jgi:outer membrane receptor protein involved in Fe transport
MLGGSTAALLAAMPVAGALAQEGDIEQVVVSASRITIAGYTQPTPVTVVGAAQLEKDAFANIQDAVRQLPQVQSPPASFSASQGSGSPGNAGLNLINLRNLGNTRTLILFDSQRVVVSNITGGVDVTTLPSAVISRVDIVTGGASAAWGSDAVAGVVNFVLNKNFSGFKATIEGSDTYNDLNRGLNLSAAWGGDMFGGRGHLVLASTVNMRPDTTLLINENWYRGSYWVSNPAYAAGNSAPQLIVANDVGLANATTGGIINSSPAVMVGGVTTTPANALRGIEFVGAGIPQLVNYGNLTSGTLSNGGSLTSRDGEDAWQTISQPSNTYTFFGYGRYKLTDTIQASLQLNYGYFTGKGSAQSNMQTGLVIKSDNAFIPASVRATMASTGITSFTLGTLNGNNYNNSIATGANFFAQTEGALAPATTFNRRQLERGVFTLEGALGDNWSWTAYAQDSKVHFTAHVLGSAILSNLNNAEDAVTVTTANRGSSNLPLGSIACRSTLTGTPFTFGGTPVTAQPGCVPLDVFGEGVASSNAIRYITGGAGQDFEHMFLEQEVAEGSMQGTLPWELPAGKVAVAFGAGYRKESGSNVATAIGFQGGYATANYTNFPSSSYNVMEGFAEVDAPILKNNIVNSLDFSMAGRMTSYSTSGLVETWKLGLNSQVNDDVKLRTTWSVDIRAPQLTDLFTPASINTGSSKDPKTQQSVTVITNVLGNPNLNPEVARTISGGMVLTPSFLDGFSLSADWFSISLTGGLGTVPTNTILNECNPTMPSVLHVGNGDPNNALCTHLVFNGPIGSNGLPSLSNINNSTVNLASQTVSGLDLQANYVMDFWNGSLAWSTFANLQDENTLTQPGSGTNDNAGTAGTPKWKGLLSADYTTGPSSFTVQTRWYGTSKNTNTANTGNLSSSTLANLYDPAHFEVPFVAYLDLRASYKWNDNIQFYGAVDNAINTPPPLVAITSGNVQAQGSLTATNNTTYDLLGRAFRLGVRFNY